MMRESEVQIYEQRESQSRVICPNHHQCGRQKCLLRHLLLSPSHQSGDLDHHEGEMILFRHHFPIGRRHQLTLRQVGQDLTLRPFGQDLALRPFGQDLTLRLVGSCHRSCRQWIGPIVHLHLPAEPLPREEGQRVAEGCILEQWHLHHLRGGSRGWHWLLQRKRWEPEQ